MAKGLAYCEHPGKSGKVQAGWHKPTGKHVHGGLSKKGTPDRAGTLLDHDTVRGNRLAWLKLRAHLNECDLNEAIAMAAASY